MNTAAAAAAHSAGRDPTERAAWLRRQFDRASPWLVVLAVIVIWEAVTRLQIINVQDVSRPAIVAALIVEWIRTGFIFPHLGMTVAEVIAGFVSGTVFGLAVAFVFFFWSRWARLFELPLLLLNAVPRTILAPFVVLLFGLTPLPKMVLAFLVVFVITIINLSAGLKEVDRTIVANVRVMGGNRRELTQHVYLPAALAWIIGAMRTSVGHAFTAAIVCELMGSNLGLGWVISTGQAAIKPDWVMAGLFFAGIVVVIADLVLLAPLERRASHWRVF